MSCPCESPAKPISFSSHPCLKPKGGNQPMTGWICDNDGRDVEFISLTEFLPRVTLIAKGVPDDVALEYLRQSAQIFCQQSRLLKRELRLDVQVGVRDYYLEQGDNEQVHVVQSVHLGNRGEKCRCFFEHFHSPRHGFCHKHFTFEPNDKIILSKPPKFDGENQLQVHYFAQPTQTACDVDKLLFDRYHDVVVNGALSQLLFMRQYDFADPQLAVVYEQRFKQGIAQGKIDVQSHFATNAPSSLAFKGRI
ncbi:phage adaptor protein [Lonepinella koalarum]|uniref:phage adaptor protein n=1 Tax=Lonepinella koalarum TaxID=53417 RepID=UPI003F6DBACF